VVDLGVRRTIRLNLSP